MKFNELTYQISCVMLVITGIYTLVYSGITGLLMTSAVSLLAAAFINEFEVIASIAVMFALFYTMFLKRFMRKYEPFTDKEVVKWVGDTQRGYQQTPQQMKNPRREPAGCYDPSIEGFADAPQAPAVPSDKKDGESKSSTAAPVATAATNAVASTKVSSGVEKFENDKKTATEEFKSATGGLFKLGEMPSEHKDGPHLDAGKTIMQSMSSFDPQAISAMTQDTKKLLETQKGLMSMLNQMRPVLADGRELLSTFSGMFGGGGGNAGNSGEASLFKL
jgi:hypothetical protein